MIKEITNIEILDPLEIQTICTTKKYILKNNKSLLIDLDSLFFYVVSEVKNNTAIICKKAFDDREDIVLSFIYEILNNDIDIYLYSEFGVDYYL